jgi:hypothetical protein
MTGNSRTTPTGIIIIPDIPDVELRHCYHSGFLQIVPVTASGGNLRQIGAIIGERWRQDIWV